MHIHGLAWAAVAIVLLATALLLAQLLRRTVEPRLPVFPRPVLTKAEIAFYHRLVRVLSRIGGVDVFPQVAMGAVMDAQRGLDKATRMAVRNRFDRKIIDFVVVDAQTNVLLIIELDDSTHDAFKDRQRDAITAAAGYATMRIQGRAARDEGDLERKIRMHLNQVSS